MSRKRNISFIVLCLFTFIQTLFYFTLTIKWKSSESSILPNCSSLIPLPTNSFFTSSDYKVTVRQILYSYDELEARHGSTIQPGGHFFPTKCRPDQRIAIIVCYRNREEHLRIFLDNIHPFLQQQQLDYTLFVVNQHKPEQFNRAALFNVGFIEAIKLYPFNCFIFHDVDLLPEDSRNIYKCGNQPRHMSSAMDKFKYRLAYSTFFGGVTSFNTDDFRGANGFPTVYWGWGGEDDDMYMRVIRQLKKAVVRYPNEIARYKMVRSHHKSAAANPHRGKILYSRYDYRVDGINTTQYTLHRVTFYNLFTLINVTLIEETYQQIKIRLKIKEITKKPSKLFNTTISSKKE